MNRFAVLLLAAAAACGGPQPITPLAFKEQQRPQPPLDLPEFDRAAVEDRYPVLRNRIINTATAAGRYPHLRSVEPFPVTREWVDDPSILLKRHTIEATNRRGSQVRFLVNGREFFREVDLVPAELAWGIKVRLFQRTLGEVRRAVEGQLVHRLGSAGTVEVHARAATLDRIRPRAFTVVGWVNKADGKPRMAYRPTDVRMAVERVDGPRNLALPNQVLVVRPTPAGTLETVIVADLLSGVGRRRDVNNAPPAAPFLGDGDIVAVPRDYEGPCAAEWESIAAFARGEIDRQTLSRRLNDLYRRER